MRRPSSRVAAMVASVVAGTATALPLAHSLAGTSASAAAPPRTTDVLRLDVSAAMKSAAKGGPNAGDHVAVYKGLIQQDNTGDPHQPSGPVAANDATITCAPSTPCTLSSPSAPFLFTPNQASADIGVPVTGAGLSGASIGSVQDAKNVTLSFSGTGSGY